MEMNLELRCGLSKDARFLTYGFSVSPDLVHVSTANQYFSLLSPMSDLVFNKKLAHLNLCSLG
jgi:hypothetical protein